MSEPHKLELQRIQMYLKYSVLWIALILLIIGHNELRNDIQLLRTSAKENLSSNPIANFEVHHESTHVGKFSLPSDLKVSGNLIVDGCILWQQPLGIYQNSCTIFTQTNLDCVHGILYKENCMCDENWWGSLCDMHDCYGRGIFQISTNKCRCHLNFDASTMCGTRVVRPTPTCTLNTCQGKCVIINGISTCICTRAGQVGENCHQCASPIISSRLCPGRFDWGIDYVASSFGVCGGGYTSAISILHIRYKICTDPHCLDFINERAKCCIDFSNMQCMDWQSFTFNSDHFDDTGVVFNSGYQKRYMAIVNTHSSENAFNLITASDWPLLRIGNLPNQPYTLSRNKFYLGLNSFRNRYPHYVLAIWTEKRTQLYLKESGFYYMLDFQLHYVFIYEGLDTFCLGAEFITGALFAHLYDNGQFVPTSANVSYWINLRNQPGHSLHPTVCAKFLVNINDNTLARVENNQKLFIGPWQGEQVFYWSKSQFSVFTS
jgi:hypothetical protein